jgi:formate-dependent nitrite reductase cytochrome c552 subunit
MRQKWSEHSGYWGKMQMRQIRKTICPQCHERQGVDIAYGMPGIELAEMAERGEAWLGGCCLTEDMPERHCLSCHHEWQIKRRSDPLYAVVLPPLTTPIPG